MAATQNAAEKPVDFLCIDCNRRFSFNHAGRSCLYGTNQNERLTPKETAEKRKFLKCALLEK